MLSCEKSVAVNRVIGSADLLDCLQRRALTLLDELEAYHACLRSRNIFQEVELRVFKRGVESEVKSLERIKQTVAFSGGDGHNPDHLRAREDEATPQLHALRSSNLPFYEAVWGIAKSSQGVTALSKRIYARPKGRITQDMEHNNQAQNNEPLEIKRLAKKGVLVDVIAENGLEWIKISTVTERRLLFEMAKEGWESYTNSSDEDGMDDNDIGEAGRIGKLELVRVAEDLRLASHGVRVQFQHPHIRFVLPNVREGVLPDVDAFIADLRATGAVVQCGMTAQPRENMKVDIDFDRLLPAPVTPYLTDTINIDCTILLALISDISHLPRQHLTRIFADNTYNKAILRQINTEELSPLVPTEIYPILSGRSLECTAQAALRMREIAQCMGTSSERIRADLILGEGVYKGQSASKLRQAWSEHTTHAVPSEIRFPIKIVDFNAQELLSSSSRILSRSEDSGLFPSSIADRATQIMGMSPINVSVFLYGWARRIVTLTSNRVAATGLLRTINEILDQSEHDELDGDGADTSFIGPQIYICKTARSLLGKVRSKGEEVAPIKHPLPAPVPI
ncbi:hypothetical protein A1O3_05141 [Capronia epimyces CBS 606.96]|uniref:DUF1308 domain-containing protein n=1 Tax=Capronia epimyces CBS 606.96 TaxID=1182542 RepID=W9XW79_9EURO|nr:uncharacterized protein A1O3_05141 [Capronia epimyces CBS 606.96]EXJ84473.1 hypothetical protein A1O3_05141 [Capronia epimyces CBS 606.96]